MLGLSWLKNNSGLLQLNIISIIFSYDYITLANKIAEI